MNDPFSDDTLLARWLSGELTEAEKRELQSHPEYPGFERMVRASERLRPPAYDTSAELARLKRERAATSERDLHPRPRKKWTLYAAAASLAVVMAALFLFRPQGPDEVVVAVSERRTLPLDDGSTVSLNADSRLVYDLDDDRRQLELRGEAFFDVASVGTPFTVRTAGGSVRVLGTRFNVYARDSLLRVSCTEGKVAVSASESSTPYILRSGQQVALVNGRSPGIVSVDTASVTGWQRGSLRFRGERLGRVIAELERQFDLTVEVDPALDTEQRITTVFSSDGSAGAALESVFGALPDVEWTLRGDAVTVVVTR